MIRRLSIFEGTSFDPHYNLAVEQYLLETVAEDQCILYLWQNENTVVIGRNQNPWKECRTTLLSQEGGHLARRLSGGGAVFHDLGNLNFTFLMPQADYDLDRQLDVIQMAVSSLGISTERSGRNDVLAEGRKFSGNAFYKNGAQAYHHGTLLVSADMEKLSRYLSPSKAKLQAKGVDSVRSRVANLRDFNPDITIAALKNALRSAFPAVYGLLCDDLSPDQLNAGAIATITEHNRSWEWNFGQKLPFSFEWEHRFPWGGLQIQLQVESGVIRNAKVYSDAMDWQISGALENALTGVRFSRDALLNRLSQAEIAADVAEALSDSIQ